MSEIDKIKAYTNSLESFLINSKHQDTRAAVSNQQIFRLIAIVQEFTKDYEFLEKPDIVGARNLTETLKAVNKIIYM